MSLPRNHRILRLPQVIEKTGLGRDSIYRLGNLGEFPRAIKLSERASGWVEHEIDEFLAKRAAERDAAAMPSQVMKSTPPTNTKPPRRGRTPTGRGKKHLQPADAA